MAIGTTTAILGGASLIASGASAVSGISQANKADEALKNLEVPDLKNPFEDIQVNTSGSDLILEESQRATAGALDVIQGSGARGVFSSLPKIISANNIQAQKAGALLDEQVQKRDYAIANYETNINQIEENRYREDVNGLGQIISNANNQMWNGINGGLSSLGFLGRNLQSSLTDVQ